MSLRRRRLDFTFQLAKTNAGVIVNFDGTNSDTVKVSGLRARAEITKSNGPSMGEAHCRIQGLTPSIMNSVAIYLPSPDGRLQFRQNNLIIEAGDDDEPGALVFQGQITLAPIDMSDIPHSALVIVAHAGAFEAVRAVPPTSYPGAADVATIMASLAAQAGYAFEPNGVKVTLATPYLWGSLRDQMAQCAAAANINWTIDNGTLSIWAKGSTATNDSVPVVSADNGMVGYPVNWNMGVYVKTLFNPLLRLQKQVDVQSTLPFANGRFTMFDLAHELESETPGGPWFTSFHGTPINAPR